MPDKPTLYIMIGLSGSGKSTVAEKISEQTGATIVSSDRLRLELYGDENDQAHNDKVFAAFRNKTKHLLRNGESIIADATHLTVKTRKALLDIAKRIDCHKEAVVLATAGNLCICNDSRRERTVGSSVIRQQMSRFQIPCYEEGFDGISIVYDRNHPYLDSIVTIAERMDAMDQNNPWHNKTVGAHAAITTQKFEEFGYSRAYNFGALFHDVGKLFTQTTGEDGISHYYNHDSIGAYYVLARYQFFKEQLGLSHNEMLDMMFLINYHMVPQNRDNEKSMRRWENRIGKEKLQLLLNFNDCDRTRTEKTVTMVELLSNFSQMEEITPRKL